MNDTFFSDYTRSIVATCAGADDRSLVSVADLMIAASAASKKVIVVGNGGSAGIASHVAVDLTKAAKIRAVCFNEAGLITCFGNDYGYEHWVAEAIEAYGDRGDLAVLISSSGKSPNMVNAAGKAREMGLTVVTLSGFAADNPLRTLGDVNLWADSSDYNFVEMAHQIWLLSIVDYITSSTQARKS